TDSDFPWCKKHHFWVATNTERRILLIVLDPAHVAHVFRPVTDLALASQARENVDLLNAVIRAEGVELPHGLDLAWALRNVICPLGGNVATRKFLEEQRKSLAMWATYRPRDGAQLFEQCCTDPVLHTHEDVWELSFRYFNRAGGVEEWSAAGNRHQIVNYSARQLLPNRTFMPPFF
ncbi:MAG TPA: hypothetical protein VFQ61_34540, partial [Polyangiaceae bacterium]|nr:hypothetical protein [Polyangiaceae bacterium]